MKVAIIGSRNLTVNNIEDYLPEKTTEIISGGAKGIDECAEKFAFANKIHFMKFLPEYNKYGKAAPLKRNLQIIEYSDCVLAFWDGKSRGTQYVINMCKKVDKPVIVIRI